MNKKETISPKDTFRTTQRGAHLGQLECIMNGDVHEKVKINHCSLDALRSYEQISSDQHKEVSKIMLKSCKNEEIHGNSSMHFWHTLRCSWLFNWSSYREH